MIRESTRSQLRRLTQHQGRLWAGASLFLLLIAGLGLTTMPPGSFWDWTGLDGKTAWDLADLLIVPLALAAVAVLFERDQKAREQRLAEQERANDRQIAQERDEEATLQAYFESVSKLLFEQGLRAEVTADTSAVFILARARTVATLWRLRDTHRRNSLLRFLHDAELPLLRGVQCVEIYLPGAYLHEAHLERADLTKANLEGATMYMANLKGATLRWARLDAALLHDADLRGARLSQASLVNTELQRANLAEASLLAANLERANLNGACLEGADLRGANLNGALLAKVTYSGTTRWPDDFTPPPGTIKLDDKEPANSTPGIAATGAASNGDTSTPSATARAPGSETERELTPEPAR